MRIGKQDNNFTAIATADADSITIRGLDLCSDLIGKVGFTDYFYFLVTGAMPTPTQRLMTDAVLVAIAEHGPRAERPGSAHDAGRCPRGRAGRRCRRYPRHGHGGRRQLGSRRPLSGRARCLGSTRPENPPRKSPPRASPRSRRAARKWPASAIRSMRAAIRAPTACSSSPTRTALRADMSACCASWPNSRPRSWAGPCRSMSAAPSPP